MMLHSIVRGEGTPIVLLHGYLSDSRYWRTLAAQLAADHQVITIDLLGFGRSPKPRSSQYSLADHVTALARTLDGLTTQPIIIVGHSMGALIAAQFAVSHPDRVKRVILVNMPIFKSRAQARELLMGTSRLYRTMLYSPLARLAWPIAKLLLRGWLAPGPRGAFSVRHTYPSRTRSLAHTIEKTDPLALLAHLDRPATLIQGTYDRTVYRENLEHAKLPDSLDLRWVDTGHHTAIDQPDIVLDAINDVS